MLIYALKKMLTGFLSCVGLGKIFTFCAIYITMFQVIYGCILYTCCCLFVIRKKSKCFCGLVS